MIKPKNEGWECPVCHIGTDIEQLYRVPCDLVKIWRFDIYITRWQDLAEGYTSIVFEDDKD